MISNLNKRKVQVTYVIAMLFAVVILVLTVNQILKSINNINFRENIEQFSAKLTSTDQSAQGKLATIPKRNYVINDSIIDVFQNPNSDSEKVTQTLMAQQIKIIIETPEWSKVKVVDGSIGWIKSDKIDKIFTNSTKTTVIIKSKLKNIYSKMNETSPLIKEITLGTELFCISKIDNWYEVALPSNSTGWIKYTDTLKIQAGTHIPKTTGSDFVETAKRFIGVPYLWGGIGSNGIDCSGLTYISSHVNGVDLPRDAQPQYDAISTSVKPTTKDMRTGDLIFFSSKIGSSAITHVGIYIGNNEFIQASSSKGLVTITSLSNNYYKERLVGVKRVFEN